MPALEIKPASGPHACRIVLSAMSTPAGTATGTELLPHALAATAHSMELEPAVETAGEIYVTIVTLRVLGARMLVEAGKPDEALEGSVEVASFLAHARPEQSELDPVLSVVVALERSRVMAELGDAEGAGRLRDEALELAETDDVRPGAAPDLLCHLLLDILPPEPGGAGTGQWYSTLGFRALQASRQVLRRPNPVQRDVAAALEVRLRVLRYCVLSDQLDDAVAVARPLLLLATTDGLRGIAGQAADLTMRALEALGDQEAADAIRRERPA